MPLKMDQYVPAPTPTTPVPGGSYGQPVVWPPGRSGIANMTWTTWDGTVWQDLLRGSENVFLCEGVIGMGGMSQTEYVSQAAESDGQFYRAGRFDAREVFWPTLLWNTEGDWRQWTSWLEWWNNGLSYHRQGTWAVQDDRGNWRRLRLRLKEPGDDHELDPIRRGWATLATKLVADQPHWEGDPIVQTFASDDGGVTMFDPKPGRIFRITSGSTLSRAKIDNPGQVEAWPVWTLYGPFDQATVGIGNKVVTIPFRVNDGEAFRLDTRGGQFLSLLGRPEYDRVGFTGGIDVVQRLSSWDIAPIQPGQQLPLNVSITGGSGTAVCELTPLYYRAFA